MRPGPPCQDLPKAIARNAHKDQDQGHPDKSADQDDLMQRIAPRQRLDRQIPVERQPIAAAEFGLALGLQFMNSTILTPTSLL